MFSVRYLKGINQGFVNYCKMSGTCGGKSLLQVVDAVNNFAKSSLAATWDNVGLLIEPSQPVNISHVLLTNDLTEKVMEEALQLKTNLIISYHPPIFAPLKRLTNQSWKERIAIKCIENKIALYSPHTSFDSIKGGVNDWLAGAFDIETSKPIAVSSENPENGMGRILTLKEKINHQKAVELIKQRVKLNHIRIAIPNNPDKLIKTVGICAGSGASLLKDVEADLFVTGEMLHHDILDAIHRDTFVILTNHSDSERGFLQEFAKILETSLTNSVKVVVSNQDADPLITV